VSNPTALKPLFMVVTAVSLVLSKCVGRGADSRAASHTVLRNFVRGARGLVTSGLAGSRNRGTADAGGCLSTGCGHRLEHQRLLVCRGLELPPPQAGLVGPVERWLRPVAGTPVVRPIRLERAAEDRADRAVLGDSPFAPATGVARVPSFHRTATGATTRFGTECLGADPSSPRGHGAQGWAVPSLRVPRASRGEFPHCPGIAPPRRGRPNRTTTPYSALLTQ